ncbi:hypothetical protein [Streptomyces sp. KHY 26]|uniref:hypothetical protein n=1 Tax=Streptomyces sp. KHY 26 TaxID=3097359 RepID=UPI00376F08E9
MGDEAEEGSGRAVRPKFDGRRVGGADPGLHQLECHLLGDQLVEAVDETRRAARTEHPAVEHGVRLDMAQDVEEGRAPESSHQLLLTP